MTRNVVREVVRNNSHSIISLSFIV